MNARTPALMSLLEHIRQHPAFPELLAEIARPNVRRFSPSQGQNLAEAQARWIFESGQAAHHETVMGVLAGTPNP